ncbi:hypothetical protein M0804_011816 [Polistes exclamans]|nr:hypothetical protein M0804_011816 [Polistes exclamans]
MKANVIGYGKSMDVGGHRRWGGRWGGRQGGRWAELPSTSSARTEPIYKENDCSVSNMATIFMILLPLECASIRMI